MDESKMMIIQLLQVLDNGEVNFKQVPALTELVKKRCNGKYTPGLMT